LHVLDPLSCISQHAGSAVKSVPSFPLSAWLVWTGVLVLFRFSTNRFLPSRRLDTRAFGCCGTCQLLIDLILNLAFGIDHT
jgi:hypothetical protein